MRLNRLTKLAKLMKEAKEQYFNLYNDMKDSIYVDQKGRTVGDVEVLPGKTLSGCITSSNINIYYTNLMGGKESKVISSNELIALIPSLTTKKGELSPTLNISKALINISIQKYNSANKLAELKKIAGTDAKYDVEDYNAEKTNTNNTPNTNVSSATSHGNKFDLSGDIKRDVIVGQKHFTGRPTLKFGGNISGCNTAHDMSLSWVDDAGRSQSTTILSDRLKNLLGSSTKIEISKLTKLTDLQAAPEGSNSNSQTTRSPAGAKTPINLKARDTVSDAWGTYTGVNQYSFSFKSKSGKEGTYDSSKSGWEQSAATINKLVADKAGTAAAPPPAAQTLAPAATTQTEKENASSPAPLDVQEKVVSEVLAQMYGQKMAGTAGIDFKNEERILKITLDSLSGTKGAGQRYAPAIARVLLSQTPALKSSVPGTSAEALANKPFLTNLQAAINSLYKNAFTWSRSQTKGDENHASLWKRIKAKTFSQADAGSILKSYMEKGLKVTTMEMKAPEEAPTQQPAPPQNPTAAPAAEGEADDGYKKSSSSIDPRIKKLATLRRLRVRSQMEAATDSSAQFGRSRVS